MRAVIFSGIFFLTSLEWIKVTSQDFRLWVYHSDIQLRVQILSLFLCPEATTKGIFTKWDQEIHK